jgi:hypothetical protein
MCFDLLMRLFSLFLAHQYLNSGKNPCECEDKNWFRVQAVPVFLSNRCTICLGVPPDVRVPQVKRHWSRKCESLDVSLLYESPRSVSGIAFYLLHFRYQISNVLIRP